MDLVPFAWLSATMLLIAAVLCLVGMWAKAFNDNLFQTIAMAIGLVGLSSRFAVMIQHQSVPFDWLLVHCAIGLFAMGTAWKVVKYSEWYREFKFRRTFTRLQRAHDADAMVAQLHEHDHIL
jgi:hypothetical protein